MRLGLNDVPKHSSPEEWAEILANAGYRAASFPVDYHAPVSVIDAYVKAARERDILIAEVGVWNSPNRPDEEGTRCAQEACEEQFRLADYVRAECCVNVSGAAGQIWYGCYAENYAPWLYDKNVTFLQKLCDRVKPEYTCYALEPMQWMLPDSPKQYRKLLADVDREHFAVHMDVVNFFKDPYTYTHKKEVIDEAFDLLGPYIRSCHVKDCILEEGTTVAIREIQPGEGTMDLAAYFKRIEETSADMPALLEHLTDMEAYGKALAVCKSVCDLL